ncbi:MAG: hypothetical protein WBA67_14055 [Jannaschia sp.]
MVEGMTAYTGGSPVPAELVIANLRTSAVVASNGGAHGFASVFLRGAASLRELELENRQLRRLLDEAEARLGLRG